MLAAAAREEMSKPCPESSQGQLLAGCSRHQGEESTQRPQACTRCSLGVALALSALISSAAKLKFFTSSPSIYKPGDNLMLCMKGLPKIHRDVMKASPSDLEIRGGGRGL